ncbi:phage tail tape measure protein [Pseudoflavonifractor sp. 524-17]|uniref:phage tail tape measure protein n=1 Tax=Pseudoflavonifractor sp. 524-17 TaxID=2304577 RepID=UPI001379858A|nr:phage tail tape measure protein [Pseudoflavonifractor sp. 524-17]
MNVFDLVARIILDTSDYENGLSNASKLAKSFGNGLKTIAKVGAVALTAATGAAAAFAGASVKVGADFDSSMSQVAATMGTTVDKIGALRDFAMEMGSKTAFSASQAADALNYMALAGYDAEQAMEALPNVLNLAAAGGIELAAASDMVTDAQSALGLSMEESAELVDKMAMASSKSNTSVAQLGEAILTVGGTAKNLAGGTTELATALGILADNGVKGAEGGTALRNIILSLTAPTDTASALMENLGIKVFDASGKMRSLNDIFSELNIILSHMTQEERMEVLSNIFNSRDLKSAEALLANAGARFYELGGYIDAASFSIDNFEKALDETNNISMSKLEQNLEKLGVSAEELNYVLSTYGKKGAKAVASGLFEVVDAGVSVDQIIQALGGDLENLQLAFDESSGAAAQMAETQLDNLSGDVIKFKSALEGAQIILSDQLTPGLREFVQFGTDGISSITDAFKEGGLSGAMEAFGTFLSDGLNMIIENLPSVINAGMEVAGALGQGLIDNLPTIIDSAIEIVTTLVDGLVSALPQLAEAAIEIITSLAAGVSEYLPELIPVAISAILQFAETLLDNADKILDAGMELLVSLAEGIANALPELIEKAPEIITKLLSTLNKSTPKFGAAGVKIVIALAGGMLESLPQLALVMPKMFFGLVQSITDRLGSMTEAGFEIISAVGEGIDNAIKGAAQWGADLIDNFVQGIKDSIGKVVDSVKNIGKTIADYIGFSEPDKGPLSNFHTYAPDMMQLFAKGIKDNEALLESAFGDALDFGFKTPDLNFETTANIHSGIGQTQNSGGVMAEQGGDIVINITETIDGEILSRRMFRYNRAESERIGAAMVQ